MVIREAVSADLSSIIGIYNATIAEGSPTSDTEPVTLKSQIPWFDAHSTRRYPIWIVEQNLDVVAWASLEPFRGRQPAFRPSAEINLFVAPHMQRQGLGRTLCWRLIEHCPSLGIKTLIAVYFDHNDSARKLFSRLGFSEVAHLTGVAELKGLSRGLYIARYHLPVEED